MTLDLVTFFPLHSLHIQIRDRWQCRIENRVDKSIPLKQKVTIVFIRIFNCSFAIIVPQPTKNISRPPIII